MTNEESKALNKTPDVGVPEVAAPPLPDADVAETSFGEQMVIARELTQQRRAVLREVAK